MQLWSGPRRFSFPRRRRTLFNSWERKLVCCTWHSHFIPFFIISCSRIYSGLFRRHSTFINYEGKTGSGCSPKYRQQMQTFIRTCNVYVYGTMKRAKLKKRKKKKERGGERFELDAYTGMEKDSSVLAWCDSERTGWIFIKVLFAK